MPTILKFNGLRAVIYLNDHRPGQIHVMGQGCEARFALRGPQDGRPSHSAHGAHGVHGADDAAGALELRENHFFTHARLNRIAAVLAAQLPRLCADWRMLHGRH